MPGSTGADPPAGPTGRAALPAGQSVTGAVIGGDNIQIGTVGGDVTIVRDRPDYRLAMLTPAATPRTVPERQRAQPSYLLNASEQVVPFWGRETELAALTSWRDGGPPSGMSVRLVHGQGGQGKTRLASRFASRSHADGWTVALAVDKQTRLRGGSLRPDAAVGKLLVVADYTERWQLSVLTRLVEDLAFDDPDRTVRVLLLARPGLPLWEEISSELDQTAVELPDPLRLGPLTTRPEQRVEVFGAAVAAFTRELRLAPRPLPAPADVDHPDYGSPLTLHMAALAAVCARRDGEAIPGREDLSAYLLGHERRGWNRTVRSLAADARFSPVSVDALRRAVLVATLLGPLDRSTARAVLLRTRTVDGESAAEQMLAVHQLLYPAPDGDAAAAGGPARPSGDGPHLDDDVLLPLRPDRLGEDFLDLELRWGWAGEMVREAMGLLAAGGAVDAEASAGVRRGLAVLAAGGRRHDRLTECLFGLLGATSQLVEQASADVVRLVVERGSPHLLHAVDAALPQFSTELLRPARDLALRLLDELPPDASPALRAARLAHAGHRLAEAGDRRAALASAREAADIFRRLVDTEADAHLPNLAAALTTLTFALSEAGERQASLTITREALDICRRLAEADPAVHRPHLAVALTNLSSSSRDAGDRRVALASAQEAADIYRQLADNEADGYVHRPHLAAALSNLSRAMSDAGDRRAALASAREAADICRRLAETNPAAHLPDLARALSNLSSSLQEAGDRRAALASAREAADIYRRLADTEPAAHLPRLAMALHNLGTAMAEAGDRRAALASAREAADIYRRLADTEADAHLPNLATTLSNLSERLKDAGDPHAAVAAASEAVQLHRLLIHAEPDVHRSGLARSLDRLSGCLRSAGDLQAALPAIREAVQIRRRLAEAEPAAQLPLLAGALHNLGVAMSNAGDREAALRPTREAAGIYRRLAEAEPAAHRPNLAAALRSQGLYLLGTDDQAALPLTREAVDIYLRLAEADPAAHRPDLAYALIVFTLARAPGKVELDEALRAAEQSVDIYRGLAAELPEAFGKYLKTAERLLADVRNDLGAS